MRTTLDLPDALAKRVKLAAVQRGVSLKTLVAQALEQNLEGAGSKPTGRPIRFPLVASRHPKAMNLTPDEIHEILIREESAAYEAAQRR